MQAPVEPETPFLTKAKEGGFFMDKVPEYGLDTTAMNSVKLFLTQKWQRPSL